MIDADPIQLMAAKLVECEGWVSWHIDEICGDFSYQGKSLRYWSSDFFEKIYSFIHDMGETRTLVLIVPLPSSNTLNISLPEYDQSLVFETAVPTLYLIGGIDVFIEAFEEYRIVLDGLNSGPGSCVFRSWRDGRSNEKGWEFSNDIYLWR